MFATPTIAEHAFVSDWIRPIVVAAPEPPVFETGSYTIDLCAGWRRVAEAPTAVFDGVIRDLAIGEWQLAGAVAGIDFQTGYSLVDVDTVRVVRDSDIVYAGFVVAVGSGAGGLTVIDTAEGEQFTLTGGDAWTVPASRVCYPTPATAPPWAASHDTRTGRASTAAAGYLLANAGNLATVDRRWPGLTVIDEQVGATGAWSARLQPLDQQIARVCRDGRITCRFTVDYTGGIVATLRSPSNRSLSVVISDEGGLSGITDIRTPAAATYVIAGGQGNLTSRTFAAAGTATGTARRERFTDQSSLTTAGEVAQIAGSTLAAAAASLTVRADLVDFAAAKLRYLKDYDIGDTISIEIDGARYPVVVESVTVHVAPDRSVVRPVLGAAVPDLVTGLIRDVAGLQSRFDTQIG